MWRRRPLTVGTVAVARACGFDWLVAAGDNGGSLKRVPPRVLIPGACGAVSSTTSVQL